MIHYPQDDDFAKEMKGESTFLDLIQAVMGHDNKKVYEVIGVHDSIIRERLFTHLCDVLQCDYEEIMQLWLKEERKGLK